MNSEHLANMLAQLKDLSEMMVDLSYSALLYGSEEVADQVLEMRETIDIVHTEFELMVLGLREERPVKGLLGLIRLAEAAESLAEAAIMMSDIVKKGVKAHPILRMAIERAEETIVTSLISEDSALKGKSLGDIGLEDDIGMRVIAVKRNGNWTYNPPDSFSLGSGDLIIARGYIEGREKLLTLANPTHEH